MQGVNASRVRDLFARLAHDRFNLSEFSVGCSPCSSADRCSCRAQWNAGSLHAESIVKRWLDEGRTQDALDSFVSAPALDLRLKATLTGLAEPQESLV